MEGLGMWALEHLLPRDEFYKECGFVFSPYYVM